MSIYFQFPKIEEYPQVNNPFIHDEQIYHPEEKLALQVDDEEAQRLKDYLNLRML